MINSEVRKFWDGPGVSFFEMEVVPPRPNEPGYLNGYFHTLYCRSLGGRYEVIAKTNPYPKDNKPVNITYVYYYLNESSPDKYWTQYSEEQVLKIIRLKAFL